MAVTWTTAGAMVVSRCVTTTEGWGWLGAAVLLAGVCIVRASPWAEVPLAGLSLVCLAVAASRQRRSVLDVSWTAL